MHSSYPITRWKPTGRVRFSVGFMGRPVPEIEFLVTTHPGNPFDKKTISSRKEWRAAKKNDVDYLVRVGVLSTEDEHKSSSSIDVNMPHGVHELHREPPAKSFDSVRDTKMRPIPPNPHRDSADGM